jgi:hypothetical protein
MRIVIRFALLSAMLVSGLATLTARAQTAQPSANGNYQFTLSDKFVKSVQFDAQTLADGSTSGSMLLSDEATIVYQDTDGDGSPQERYAGFYIKAEFDGLVVNGNRAVMSGTVRDASIPYLLGLRVLLTVEDNGDNTRVPDKVMWGAYKPINRDWKPSDAELKDDPGVGLRWWATDAEIKDDRGYQMPRSEAFDTQTFPIATYDFVVTSDGVGDIVVRP